MSKCQWLTPVPDRDHPEFTECESEATASRVVPLAFGAAAKVNLCIKHRGEHDGRFAAQRKARRAGGK